VFVNLEYDWDLYRGGRGLLEVRFKKPWLESLSKATKEPNRASGLKFNLVTTGYRSRVPSLNQLAPFEEFYLLGCNAV
jgi:hypothetical protein